MKLVIFGPFKRLGGLLKDGGIVDLNLAYAAYLKGKEQARPQAQADAELPAKLQEFLEEGDSALKAARSALAYARKQPGELVIRPEGVKIWAPLPSLHARIICSGGSFAEHIAGSIAMRQDRETTQADIDRVMKETAKGQIPTGAHWKLARSVIGPDEPMIYPSAATHLDYEVEFVAIIGKQGKNIPNSEKAMDYVFGYTGFIDWSIREYHPAGDRQLSLHKNFDTAASLGPCIVTKDELPDPYNIRLQLWLNGELRQDAKTNLMMLRAPTWIAHVSRNLTIYPGDMFTSGTPKGTASDTTRVPKEGPVPADRFVKVGDIVEVSVEGIGSMRNKVIAG